MQPILVAAAPDVPNAPALHAGLAPVAAGLGHTIALLEILDRVPITWTEAGAVDPDFLASRCSLLVTTTDGFAWHLVLRAAEGITPAAEAAAKLAAVADLSVASIFIIGTGDLEALGSEAYAMARTAGLFLPESEVFSLTSHCRRITRLR